MSVRIQHARAGLLLAVDESGRTVGAAARVAGSDPEQWVVHFAGSERYHTNLSELSAVELLRAGEQTGRAS